MKLQDYFVISGILLAGAMMVIGFVFTPTDGPVRSEATVIEAVEVPEPAQRSEPRERTSGGIGMSYTGRVGIEVAPGLVLTPSGGISPGFGF